MPQLIKAPEQAALLSCTVRTLRSRVAKGIIPAIKLPGKTFSNGRWNIDRGELLFDPDAVNGALLKYAINQPRPPKRRAVRLTEEAR